MGKLARIGRTLDVGRLSGTTERIAVVDISAYMIVGVAEQEEISCAGF
jgi:hypothetical protein